MKDAFKAVRSLAIIILILSFSSMLIGVLMHDGRGLIIGGAAIAILILMIWMGSTEE